MFLESNSKVFLTTLWLYFGVGFVPVSGAEEPIMMAAQTAMIGEITSVYGVDIRKNQMGVEALCYIK